MILPASDEITIFFHRKYSHETIYIRESFLVFFSLDLAGSFYLNNGHRTLEGQENWNQMRKRLIAKMIIFSLEKP